MKIRNTLLPFLLLLPSLAFSQFKVYGYLTTWALQMGASVSASSNYENCLYTNIDWDACTDYITFNASFASDGSMALANDWATNSNSAWGNAYFQFSKRRFLNDYIHSKGKSVQLCFFISSSDPLLKTSTGKNAIIKTVVDSVIGSANQYDGVHWDIEPFTDGDSLTVRAFLSQMRDTLNKYHQWIDPTKKPLQTIATYRDYSFWATCPNLYDAVLDMSYDMFANWITGISWYNAPLFQTNYPWATYNNSCIASDMADIIELGVPANKLVMACPFNYNAFQGGVSSGSEGIYAPLLSMKTYPNHLNGEMFYLAWNQWLDTMTWHYDSVRVAAWAGQNNSGSANDLLILFQDTVCVRRILQYEASQGIQGTMVWEIPGAYINSPNQTRHPGLKPDFLLQAVKKTRLALSGSVLPPIVAPPVVIQPVSVTDSLRIFTQGVNSAKCDTLTPWNNGWNTGYGIGWRLGAQSVICDTISKVQLNSVKLIWKSLNQLLQ